MAHDVDPEADTCFLACTRPAMFLGVTMEAFGFNVVGTVIACLVLGSFRYAVIGVALHFGFRALIWHDHNRFRVLLAWLETRGRMRNGMIWGGSSATPLPLGRTYTDKDFLNV
jgi:type IV secretion system protein VirB3